MAMPTQVCLVLSELALVCSTVQFVSQCVLTAVYISVAVFSQSDEQVATFVRPIVMPVFPYVLDVICLSSAPSLLFLRCKHHRNE